MDKLKIKDFIVLWDNVLVDPIKIVEKDGLVRPQQEEDKSELGTVISIGAGVESNGLMSVGDIVLYNKYSSTKTDMGEELILRAEDVVAVLKKKKK